MAPLMQDLTVDGSVVYLFNWYSLLLKRPGTVQVTIF